ncbi:MAG: hypothetical protein Q9220_001267 [cf. Caloplaca sp. 1 TL-2023]
MVKLTAGDKKHVFYAHKRRLCAVSWAFDDAFNKSTEKKCDSMTLVEESAETIDHFLTWVYERKIHPGPWLDKSGMQHYYRLLVDLHAFAGKHDVEQLEYDVVKQLETKLAISGASASNIDYGPDVGTIEYIYAKTTPRSDMRTCVAAHMVSTTPISKLKEEDFWSKFRHIPDLAEDIATAMAAKYEAEIQKLSRSHVEQPLGRRPVVPNLGQVPSGYHLCCPPIVSGGVTFQQGTGCYRQTVPQYEYDAAQAWGSATPMESTFSYL